MNDSYIQLIAPNLGIIGTAGDCLVYVRDVFGVTAKYLTAISAWQNVQYQHTGTPPNVAVPIWFSWETDGHVAVWDNGTIYSTTAQGDMTFSSIQGLMDYIGGGIEYLGWSEDINSVRVVEEEVTVGVTITGSPASIWTGSSRVDVFVRGSDNNLYQKTWDGKWENWVEVGQGIFSDPSVSSTGATRYDVFGLDNLGNLTQWTWDGSWQAPVNLGTP